LTNCACVFAVGYNAGIGGNGGGVAVVDLSRVWLHMDVSYVQAVLTNGYVCETLVAVASLSGRFLDSPVQL
jgi:hypothetical protein